MWIPLVKTIGYWLWRTLFLSLLQLWIAILTRSILTDDLSESLSHVLRTGSLVFFSTSLVCTVAADNHRRRALARRLNISVSEGVFLFEHCAPTLVIALATACYPAVYQGITLGTIGTVALLTATSIALTSSFVFAIELHFMTEKWAQLHIQGSSPPPSSGMMS